jgi:hypothetical protein
MLSAYTAQQSRFDQAFSVSSTCSSTTCANCGRTYFVTSPGHGGYEEGELDELRAKAEAEPNKYVEVPDFGSVATWQGLVVGCICDPTKRYSDWIEDNAEALVAYLKLYWQAKANLAANELRTAEEMLATLEQTAVAPDGETE